eukprot:TRINITY_DN14028_c0_g1_i1.p1 TRINITY_DN14028_c0_g1~~TRINITY_DN14028_c0_g1_i1.p1  ORF type:complete len:390 (+),score=112.85 TRINITY_DN14028_c0_g1_i1:99-1172(+)
MTDAAPAASPASPADAAAGRQGSVKKRKEIYTYELPFTGNALSWSVRTDQPFRLAVASYMEEYQNKVHIVQLDDQKNELTLAAQFDHPYPATKIMWLPDARTDASDLLASTGDYLRLWEVNARNKDGEVEEGKVATSCCLNNNKRTDFCAPLTSFDWNNDDVRLVGTSSIDTTCSIWDIEAQQPITQLIAHEKEVFDIAFAKGTDIFASVGGDGSVRLFDLRSLEHSTILYETQECKPLLRVCWNRQDPNYLATIPVDGAEIVVLDVRVPSIPIATLDNHTGPVNSVGWAPHSSCHLCSAADDCLALIWDISGLPAPIEDPILAYNAENHINWLQWSALQTDWIAIAFAHRVQILRV